MHDKFREYLSSRYQTVKSTFPGEGRRRWHLRVVQDFWDRVLPEGNSTTASENNLTHDDDPTDDLVEGNEPGILLRTDYSNEDAWQMFSSRLQASEQELADAIQVTRSSNTDCSDPSISQQQTGDSDSDIMDIPDNALFPMIKVMNPPTTERIFYHNISNLTALRLMNDVDIRPAPSPPPGVDRIHPPHRLIDQRAWQEIYSGMTIWIYDTQSNTDQCARLISQKGDIYGTATGDSWRVQGSQICALQFSMSFESMTLNFGGLDRWDYRERQRNLEEANQALKPTSV